MISESDKEKLGEFDFGFCLREEEKLQILERLESQQKILESLSEEE